ncbi:MAG: ATP-binding protein [Blastocatellia bacterium]
MNNSGQRQVLGRLSDEEFFDRRSELDRIQSLARGRGGISLDGHAFPDLSTQESSRMRRPANALLLGAPRVGKSELLRRSFDLLFNEAAEVVPIYYALKPYAMSGEKFARDFLAQLLSQFIAFRRNDARLIAAADEPLAVISRAAAPEDYLWIRALVDSFTRAVSSGDEGLIARCAVRSPLQASARAQTRFFVMIDNFHLLAKTVELRSEFISALSADRANAAYLLCGLQRVMPELMPPDEELYGKLELIRLNAMNEETVEKFIRATAESLNIETSDSTIELMIQQLHRDPFYIRALLDATAARASSLKSFMEFERVYTDEVLNGRISHYLGALLREVASDSRSRRAALEAMALIIEADDSVPTEAVIERMSEDAADGERLLARMHALELLEINYGFVRASKDPVMADYVRAKYRSEIVGVRRPVAGEELLGEKLKHSYRLMMSRYNRSVESELVEMLSRFDFQSVPTSLFDLSVFDKRYRGMSRVQVRRALDEEPDHVRLPQIVLVHDTGAGEQPGITWRLFAASGFEGGIYSESNEVTWLIALINSKEPMDVETLNRLDQRFESVQRGSKEKSGRVIRWYISKEGFSAVASERLSSLRAYRSTFSQLDLIHHYLIKLFGGDQAKPASEFELIIPVYDEAELIAARTVEQIARAADFEQEAINQIKTALIEACINAAEHSDSPDRRIYQKFAIEDDRLIITISNKGKTFGSNNGQSPLPIGVAPQSSKRGRGLQIIRALMDEVRFERTDDGTSLVMTKYLKRPENQ